MLTSHEEKFIAYWEKNRDREKKLLRQFFIGLPFGLLISAGILLSLDMNWYERANMIANAELNPVVLLIALLAIAVFMAIFYKKYQWDMKEQQYKELVHKRNKATKSE
ncbi:hypothetical protein [Limnovirga soli]|jgi:glucan phosphoethanolaminetransferase (alkaline phosphatase superfamily)|uniref:Uncharacterized protein n=1 Tax=Limnovirga soli TaxID=2656915 RepID=A0A8J8FE33_9BACT|nr:hypothetical protein [Limnovirga soli]NNV56381.1 hypothetical protein [Limnovirga soli]